MHLTKWIWAVLPAAALAACAEGTGGRGASSGSSDGGHPLVGTHAPAFDRPAVGGPQAISTSSAKNKVLIVDFWATYCEPCLKSFPKLQTLAERHKGDVVVYGISEDEETDGIGAFVKKTGVSFPVAWDKNKSIGEKYKLESMPSTYVIDGNGVVRFVHRGYHDGEDEELAREVRSLLK